jgi:small ligand-binding sensory domain FIST
MSVKTYLVQFKPSGMIAQLVIATSAEIEGDQIVMRGSQGEMVASFSMDFVESWTASDRHGAPERPS